MKRPETVVWSAQQFPPGERDNVPRAADPGQSPLLGPEGLPARAATRPSPREHPTTLLFYVSPRAV